MTNGFKGIIFDLDGTLIDSFVPIYESFNHALTSLGYPEKTFEETKNLIGPGLEDTFFCLLDDMDIAVKATKTFRELYSKIYLDKTTLLPHVSETVEGMYKKGYSLSVATNKLGRYSRDLIHHLGLSEWIGAVIGAGDGVREKPDPEILAAAASASGISYRDALFVGDSKIDIETGFNAGIPVIAVATGTEPYDKLLSYQPYMVIGSLKELTGIL